MAFRTEAGRGEAARSARGRVGLASVALVWLLGMAAWAALPAASRSLGGNTGQAAPAVAAASDDPATPPEFARFAANAQRMIHAWPS